MTVAITFFAQFTKTNLGVDDLTVTVDVVKVARADGAQTAVVTGGSASQITAPSKRGGYLYVLTGADPSLYDYLATFITSGDVDLKEVPALHSAGTFATDASGVARANDASGNAVGTAANQTTIIAKTNNLPSDPTGLTNLAAAHGAGAWGPGSAGTGAFVVTLTIDDGTNPLEGIFVRLSKTGTDYNTASNASGIATINVAAGTWTVILVAPNGAYTFDTTTLVISADTPHTYHMTAVNLNLSDLDKTTGFLPTIDENGDSATGIDVYCYGLEPTTGVAMMGPVRTNTSAGSPAKAQFTNMIPGSLYRIRVGAKGEWKTVRIPQDAGANCVIPIGLIGKS